MFVFLMLCKFLEPNVCFTLQVHSDVCDSLISLLYRLLYWSHTMG